MNKKGGLPDFVDIFLIILFGVGLYFLLGAIMFLGVNDNETLSMSWIKDFKQKSAAVNYLRLEVHDGVSLEGQDINQMIRDSKVIGGKIITKCEDYRVEVDCKEDTVSIVTEFSASNGQINNVCIWYKNKCEVGSKKIKGCYDYPTEKLCKKDSFFQSVLNIKCNWNNQKKLCEQEEET